MADLFLICPHCGTKLEADTDMLGHTIECPSCRGPLSLPTFVPSQTAGGRSPPPIPSKPLDGLAIASLLLGICSLLMGPVGFVLGLPAILSGELSERRIRRAPQRFSGKAMARAGRILGYISILISVLCIGSCMFFSAM